MDMDDGDDKFNTPAQFQAYEQTIKRMTMENKDLIAEISHLNEQVKCLLWNNISLKQDNEETLHKSHYQIHSLENQVLMKDEALETLVGENSALETVIAARDEEILIKNAALKESNIALESLTTELNKVSSDKEQLVKEVENLTFRQETSEHDLIFKELERCHDMLMDQKTEYESIFAVMKGENEKLTEELRKSQYDAQKHASDCQKYHTHLRQTLILAETLNAECKKVQQERSRFKKKWEDLRRAVLNSSNSTHDLESTNAMTVACAEEDGDSVENASTLWPNRVVSVEPLKEHECEKCTQMVRSEKRSGACFYHLVPGISYETWKRFMPEDCGKPTNHKYWICCEKFSLTRPEGCHVAQFHTFSKPSL